MGWDQIESKWLAMTRRVRTGEAANDGTQVDEIVRFASGRTVIPLPGISQRPVLPPEDHVEPQR